MYETRKNINKKRSADALALAYNIGRKYNICPTLVTIINMKHR